MLIEEKGEITEINVNMKRIKISRLSLSVSLIYYIKKIYNLNVERQKVEFRDKFFLRFFSITEWVYVLK